MQSKLFLEYHIESDPKKRQTSSNFNELDITIVTIILIFIDLGLIISYERCVSQFPFTLRKFSFKF